MSGTGRRAAQVIGCFVLSATLLTCLIGAGAVAARHAIATRIARDRLEARGVRCDERFALEVSWSLDRAEVGPTTCTLTGGPVASVEILDRVEVVVDHGEPVSAEGGAVRIALRGDLPPVRGAGFGAVLDALDVAPRIAAMVAGFAELARTGAPAIALRSVEITREGATLIAIDALRADGASPLALSARRAALPTIAGPMGARADVALEEMRASATAARVTLDANLTVDATLPVLGRVQEARPVSVVVEGLDTERPRWELR